VEVIWKPTNQEQSILVWIGGFLVIERRESMVLVLKNEEMEDLVPMAEELEVVEQAFREMGEGKAVNSPRARLRVQAPG
jgi:hypothetical protein